MTKTICDICGKEMPTTKLGDRPYANQKFCISSCGKAWDVCGECRESFYRWTTIRRQGCDVKECSYKTESEK